MDLRKIKSKTEQIKYKGGLRQLATDIGMTEANLHRCIRENKIQAQDLEMIAKLFGISIAYFFDEIDEPQAVRTEGDYSPGINSGTYSAIVGAGDAALAERLESAQKALAAAEARSAELIAAKDDTIAQLKAHIATLQTIINAPR